MKIKQKTFAIGFIFLTLAGLVFFFFGFQSNSTKKEPLYSSNRHISLNKDKTSRHAVKNQSLKDIPQDQAVQKKNSDSNCRILKTEPIVVFSPMEGSVKYLVKENSKINKGDIIAHINRISNIETNALNNFQDQDVLKEEILSKENDIHIARMDIKNIQDELDKRNNNVYEAQLAYSNALINFEDGTISKKKLSDFKELYDRFSIHLQDLEKMIDGKYTSIKSYENRILDLKNILSSTEPSTKENTQVISTYGGVVDELFYNNGEKIGENQPLMTINSTNTASIEYFGKIPFSADGADASLIIDNGKFKASGKLRLAEYKDHDDSGAEITRLWLIFSNESRMREDLTGKTGALSY